MLIRLSKEKMEELFLQYLGEIFKHPEIKSAVAKEITITRETIVEAGKKAFEACFHDIYSDIDMSVKVCLPKDGSISPEEYFVFKNGMRYDLCFEFEYYGEEGFDLESYIAEGENSNWPLENINRFWFIQIQALGKLYRKDYLISNHLAHINCNDTLVMQMVLRDLKYGTNHHRYGYSDEPEYIKDLGKNPYKNNDETFNRIADYLYAAALSYDRLAKIFYPEYQDRSEVFFAIWDQYESHRE